MNSSPLAIVLAAGKGSRMKSDLPKVLFPVCGRPMIHFVLDALDLAGFTDQVAVVGHRADNVKAELEKRPAPPKFALQREQLGTGHAVMQCCEFLDGHEGPVLVVAGDSPLIQPSSLKKLLTYFEATDHRCCWERSSKRTRGDWDASFATQMVHSSASSNIAMPRKSNCSYVKST